MSFIKCFDVVSMVVEEATKQFAPTWEINRENYEKLEQYCSAVDLLTEKSGIISYNATVDEVDMTVSITLECDDLTVESKSHAFIALAKRAISVEFSTSEDKNLNVRFTFPGIWNHI